MIIGLTGGVFAGKSTVARELERCGAVVVDADRIGHEVIAPGRPAWRELRRAFGDRILSGRAAASPAARGEGAARAGRAIDRRALGAIVFADPRARRRLNAIVHPRLIRELARRVRRQERSGAVVVIDAALLIELGWRDRVDVLLVVDAPRRMQLARLIRAGFGRREALDRIRAQATRRERRRAADRVLVNEGSRSDLRRAARRLWKEIVARPPAAKRGPRPRRRQASRPRQPLTRKSRKP